VVEALVDDADPEGLEEVAEFSMVVGFFLNCLCLVPGRLSGPRRFGAASYSHTSDRRTQLLHTGLVESQRILRPRLHCDGKETIEMQQSHGVHDRRREIARRQEEDETVCIVH